MANALLLELLDEPRGRVSVDLGHVLDERRLLRIAQRRDGLWPVILPRRDRGDHRRATVAAERVLEEVGELRVAVGYVAALPLGKGLDDARQVHERQVDLLALLEARPLRSRLRRPLRAGEIDQ